jgi:hypothetical protein
MCPDLESVPYSPHTTSMDFQDSYNNISRLLHSNGLKVKIELSLCLIKYHILEVPRCEGVFRECTRVCPKVSGLAAWSENCKWYSSLPLGAVI